MIYKKYIFFFLSILFIITATPAFFNDSALAEIIYLKNGSVIKGNIVKEGKNEIFVRNEAGEEFEIKLNDTQRILYGNNEMEKIFIITNSGKTLKGYMVDQDDDKVVIRENPSSPEEKTFLKKDIRQISREEIYPLDLELIGRPGWFMPLDSGGADLSGSLLYSFGLAFNSTLIMNLRLILEAGYTCPESPSNKERHLQIIPITLGLSYRFGTERFGIVPKIGAGIALLDFDTGEGKKYGTKAFDGIAGLGLTFGFTRNISAGLWGEYLFFHDGSDYLQGTVLSLSCSYRF